jgi:hypothetical protein
MKCTNCFSLLSATAMVYTKGFAWLDNHLEVVQPTEVTANEGDENTTLSPASLTAPATAANEGDEKTTLSASLTAQATVLKGFAWLDKHLEVVQPTEVTANEGDENTTLSAPATVLQDNKDVMVDPQKPSKSRSAIYKQNNPHKKKVYNAQRLEKYYNNKKHADELAAKGDTSLQDARKQISRLRQQKLRSRHAASHEAAMRQKKERELADVFEKMLLSLATTTERQRYIAAVFPEKKQCSPEAIVEGGDDDVGDTHRPVVAEKSLATTTERQRDDDGGDTHRPVVTDLSLAATTEGQHRFTALFYEKIEKKQCRVFNTLPPEEMESDDDSSIFGSVSSDSSSTRGASRKRKPQRKLQCKPKSKPKPQRMPKSKPKCSSGRKRVRHDKDNGNFVDANEIVTNDREDSLEKEDMQKLRAALVHERRQHMSWLFTHVPQTFDPQTRDLVSNTTERFRTLASKPNKALENKLKELDNRLQGIPDNKNETIVETIFIKDYKEVDGDRDSLSDKDVMAVIKRGGMLSDATLHFYSGLLNERDYARHRMMGVKRSGIFSCFFITLLLLDPAPNGIDYQSVAPFRKSVPGTNSI